MLILQINLHHSRIACANLLIHLERGGVDVVLIQEPWIVNGKVSGIRTTNYKLVVDTNSGRPRSCMLIKKELYCYIISPFSNGDIVTAQVTLGSKSVWVVSAYMAHDDDYEQGPPPYLLQQAVAEAKRTNKLVLIGADANAHHEVWGSSNINDRGESLFNYIINNDLVICNKGSEPTFITSNRKEVLDITLSSSDLEVVDWKVLGTHSFSDHRYIQFNLKGKISVSAPYRNYKLTNWDLYRANLRRKLPNRPPRLVTSPSELDAMVHDLTLACNTALDLSCPLKRVGKKNKPPWWSPEIQQLRLTSRRSFNKAKASCLQSDWDTYKENLRKFKIEVRKCKRRSWRSFCEKIESISECSRLRRILSKKQPVCGLLKSDTGIWTSTTSESLDLLVSTHFQESRIAQNCHREHLALNDLNDLSIVSDIVTKQKIKWAINSFQPFKTPGLDGIIPAQLQNSLDVSCNWLHTIFESCFSLNYIPDSWNTARVIFIPKAGKSSHIKSKDFRPISLTSFLLKTLERLLDLHIRNRIPRNRLSSSQHAYCRGKSVDTALHSLVGEIETAFHHKEFALGAFLDIEGAFNNVYPKAILDALIRIGVNFTVIKLIRLLLVNRKIKAEWGDSIKISCVNRGTPQGGVLSPLLWLIVVNELLLLLESEGCNIIAFADDIALLVKGKFPNSLCEILQNLLRIIDNWASTCGLSVNPDKTQLVLFTRKYKPPSLKLPKIRGNSLILVKEVKYLGLVIDSKLSWGPAIDNRITKATVAFYSCKCTIGKKWGLTPKLVLWIYKAIVEPILLYAVFVWWPSLTKACNTKRLEKVQRSALLGISGAMRTTSSIALNALLNILPIDLSANKIAALTAIRLREQGNLRAIPFGHSSILNDLEFLPGKTDYCISPTQPEKPFLALIPRREEWLKSTAWQSSHLNFFTDGSKLNDQVGGGLYCRELDLRIHFRLPDHCSVFQAEIAAIKEVLDWLQTNVVTCNTVSIYTDSQASIKSLLSASLRSKFASECLASLMVMTEYFQIKLIWVPGHCDIPGNCIADSLARQGTTAQVLHSKEGVGMPMATCRLLINQWVQNKFASRWSSTHSCKHTKTIWPVLDVAKSRELLSLPKSRLSATVGIITGHCPLGVHALRLKIRHELHCRSCLEEELESPEHIMLQCPAFARLRHKLLGSYFLNSLEDLKTISLARISRFITESATLEREN